MISRTNNSFLIPLSRSFGFLIEDFPINAKTWDGAA